MPPERVVFLITKSNSRRRRFISSIFLSSLALAEWVAELLFNAMDLFHTISSTPAKARKDVHVEYLKKQAYILLVESYLTLKLLKVV